MTTTIREALAQGIQRLRSAGASSARLDSQVLLGQVLQAERTTLLTYPERSITDEQLGQFLALIERRSRHEPIAYLLGQKAFYGLDFFVDPRVLIPRPETELLVEIALVHIRQQLSTGRTPLVADIGTGSGAIPITIAVEAPELPRLYATDISADALAVARRNCQRHQVTARVQLLQGDLLTPLPEPVDILTANLPYVGLDEMQAIAPDVSAYEPHLALFSGQQGLDTLHRFCQQLRTSAVLKPGALVLLEIGYRQSTTLIEILHEALPHSTATVVKDYAGWDRILKVTT